MREFRCVDIELRPKQDGSVQISVPVRGAVVDVWARWDWSLALDAAAAGTVEGTRAVERVHAECSPLLIHEALTCAHELYEQQPPLEWVGELPWGHLVSAPWVVDQRLHADVEIQTRRLKCILGPTPQQWRTDLDPELDPEEYDLIAGTAKHAVVRALKDSEEAEIRLFLERFLNGFATGAP